MTDNGTHERLDKWLFCARLYRSRALAQAAASSGRLRLNGARVDKPARMLQPGDVLTLTRGGHVLSLLVLALAERREPASMARALYRIMEDTDLRTNRN